MFCLVEIFSSSCSLVERNPTECCVCGCHSTGSTTRRPCCTPGCCALTRKGTFEWKLRIISLFICWFISVFPWKQQRWVRFIEHKVRRLLPGFCWYGVIQRIHWWLLLLLLTIKKWSIQSESHKVSKNPAATSKFQMPEGCYKAVSILRTTNIRCLLSNFFAQATCPLTSCAPDLKFLTGCVCCIFCTLLLEIPDLHWRCHDHSFAP